MFISHFVKTPQTLALFSSSNITSKKCPTKDTLSWCHRRPAQGFLAKAPRQAGPTVVQLTQTHTGRAKHMSFVKERPCR